MARLQHFHCHCNLLLIRYTPAMTINLPLSVVTTAEKMALIETISEDIAKNSADYVAQLRRRFK